MKVSALAACTALLLSPAYSADPAKRLITATDLYAFQWIANPQISPNGAQIVYTHIAVTPKHDGYDTALWIVPTAGGAPPPAHRRPP